jgi:hypothetical protein
MHEEFPSSQTTGLDLILYTNDSMVGSWWYIPCFVVDDLMSPFAASETFRGDADAGVGVVVAG